MKKRFIIIVLDSLGVGAMPDAVTFGDGSANTLAHIAAQVSLTLPCLTRLGLGNILPLANVPVQKLPQAAWGKMAEQSQGMDTTTGHWEIAGLVLDHAMPVFPHGFPPEMIAQFCQAIGRGILGNCVASGTQII